MKEFTNRERKNQHGIFYRQYEHICKKCDSASKIGTVIGICIDCKEEKEIYASSLNCKPCSAKRSRDRRRKNTALGLCSCGREQLKPSKKCEKCLGRKSGYKQNGCEKTRAYRKRNNERLALLAKLRSRTQKILILSKYGGQKCLCCGETTIEFLSLDHIAGDGAKHRREIGGGANTYRWIIKNNFPPGFQVLCMNCNFAKGKYGCCPHGNLPEAMPQPEKLIPPIAQAPHRYPLQ